MSTVRQKTIIEGIKNLTRKLNGDYSIIEARVKSVDDNNLVLCEADGLEIHDVQLRALKSGKKKSLVVIPKVGSYVLIGSIEGQQDYIILSVDEAEKVIAHVGDITFDILSDKIKLNGDKHGGLLIEDKLVSELDLVNNILTAIKQVCSTPINEPGNGAPSAFQATLNGVLSSLKTPSYNNISNNKVTHG